MECTGDEPAFSSARTMNGASTTRRGGEGLEMCISSADIPVNDYPVKLVGGDTEREGRVEIYYNKEWGAICDDHWTQVEGDVVCSLSSF